jgi:hypothetical protein
VLDVQDGASTSKIERMCVPTAFQWRSVAAAKVLLECDRRSRKIEIKNAQKRGTVLFKCVFSPAPFSRPMVVVVVVVVVLLSSQERRRADGVDTLPASGQVVEP